MLRNKNLLKNLCQSKCPGLINPLTNYKFQKVFLSFLAIMKQSVTSINHIRSSYKFWTYSIQFIVTRTNLPFSLSIALNTKVLIPERYSFIETILSDHFFESVFADLYIALYKCNDISFLDVELNDWLTFASHLTGNAYSLSSPHYQRRFRVR